MDMHSYGFKGHGLGLDEYQRVVFCINIRKPFKVCSFSFIQVVQKLVMFMSCLSTKK